ncbi:hypothetical protein [Burkholderia cepacia]|uniref:hypothetical protein n=1 Tax=Burkholderia cepacia TaxID=292 RepID=UPI0012DB609B|nr:hypothetical protein [Burkholderia cepacia]
MTLFAAQPRKRIAQHPVFPRIEKSFFSIPQTIVQYRSDIRQPAKRGGLRKIEIGSNALNTVLYRCLPFKDGRVLEQALGFWYFICQSMGCRQFWCTCSGIEGKRAPIHAEVMDVFWGGTSILRAGFHEAIFRADSVYFFDAEVALNRRFRRITVLLTEKIVRLAYEWNRFTTSPAIVSHFEWLACGTRTAGWPGPATGPALRCPVVRASCARRRNTE